MRRFTAGFSGLFLGISFFGIFLWTGNLSLFQIVGAAAVAFMGLIEPVSIIWDRVGGKPLTQPRSSTNPERDEKRYLKGRIEQFDKEEKWFIPLQGDIENVEFQTEQATYDAIEQVLKDHERFVLIGAPGAGKSTTLRHLWRNQAERYLNAGTVRLPLWVFLGRGNNPDDAAQLVNDWWTNEAVLPDSADNHIKTP